MENLHKSHEISRILSSTPFVIPLEFLVIGNIVFDGSRDTFGLHTIDVRCCDRAIQMRVFRE